MPKLTPEAFRWIARGNIMKDENNIHILRHVSPVQIDFKQHLPKNTIINKTLSLTSLVQKEKIKDALWDAF